MSIMTVKEAGDCVKAGGVVAYPTEAVYGLGCDPFNESAVRRIHTLKKREAAKGFIVLVSSWALVKKNIGDLDPADLQRVRGNWPGPHTWLLPNRSFPQWITGDHDGVALRITAHPIAAALCNAAGGYLVSTSANMADQEPLRTAEAVAAVWPAGIDAVVEGEVGRLERPTPIRDARTGQVWRA